LAGDGVDDDRESGSVAGKVGFYSSEICIHMSSDSANADGCSLSSDTGITDVDVAASGGQ
jgi:hypothetical protein